jgi:hypothetical protein
LTRKLKRELPGYDVSTVQEMGWASIRNGELIKLMTGKIDVFITGDQNLRYQQNLSSLKFAIIVLIAVNNNYKTLQPLMPLVLAKLPEIKPGEIIEIN